MTRGKRNTELRNSIQTELQEADSGLAPKQLIERIHDQELVEVSDDKAQRLRRILSYEARKDDGLVLRMNGGYKLRTPVEDSLKQRIKDELEAHGFEIGNGGIEKPEINSKEDIRKLHAGARREKYEENKEFLEEKEDELLPEFADGSEIDIDELWPRLEVVEAGTHASDLFRYATLLWSVPVSQGFGRRVRFLVWDEHTDKLIGLFALGDPVFNLSCRDDWIGWDHEDRTERLYNVMDIFILGAVPPYNILLGGKLIAMLATSNKVREIIYNRYKGQETVIEEKDKDPRLALLTTGSALGKSALYDRIRYDDRVLYQRIGASKGWGHFHLNNGVFDDMREYLQATRGPDVGGNDFGDGPNWKIRTARGALNELGLPEDLMRHGIQREIYGIPLGKNFDEFLRGETDTLDSYDIQFDDIAGWWKERWLQGRAERKPEYVEHEKEEVAEAIHSAGSIGTD